MKSNWKIVKISEVLSFQEGPGVRKHQFTSKGVKLLNVGNINNGQINLDTTKIYISSEEAFGKYKHFLVDEGDLVIASSGIVVNNFHNKIAFIKNEHLPLCMNTSTIRFKAIDKKIVDINYFKYFLKTRYFSNQLQKLITGSAQLNFGPSHLKKIDLLLPPIDEQEHIVKILDQADQLRQKRKQAIMLLDDYLKSVFSEMFGEVAKNEKGWETKKLNDLCEVGSSKRVFVDELTEVGVPFYRGTEIGLLSSEKQIQPKLFISNDHYKELKKHSGVPAIGDLLLPSICPDGRIWLVDTEQEFYFKDGRVLWIHIKDNMLNSIYLKFYLKEKFRKEYKNIASGTTFAELKIFALKKMNIMLPPNELQNRFSNIVEKTGKLRDKMINQSLEIESKFQALINQTFSVSNLAKDKRA